MDKIETWKNGLTGVPIVDATMRDLKATGYIGNRGRQIAASYLTQDLHQDWRFGAYHFEEFLIDHDVCSNTGGWSSSAGLGPSTKQLHFDPVSQGKQHDKDGQYVRMWCPEFKERSNDEIHDI